MKEKICLQYFSSSDPLDPYNGMFVSKDSEGSYFFVRNPDDALSFDTIIDAVDEIDLTIIGMYRFFPVLIRGGGEGYYLERLWSISSIQER